MMKKIAALLALCGIDLGTTSFYSPIVVQKPTIRTIILDAGHGGIDPGTHGLISKEKDVTLEITLKLGEAIKKEFPEIKIVYTRTTDILPGNAATKNQGLYNRAQIANEAKGDLFLCIHCDATPKPAGGYYEKRVIGHKKKLEYVGKGKHKRKKMVNAPIYESYWVKNTMIGATTYIWKADRSGTKGNAIDQTGEGEDIEDSTIVWDTESPEARIRAQLYEQKYFKKSVMMASYVEDEFEKTGRKTWGVKQRAIGLHVLENTGMPSVLIETGYLTNKEEEEYLNSDKGQDEVVTNIMDALKRYKQSLEGNKPSPTSTNGPSK